MAFFKRRKGKRRIKASKSSHIQEIKSPYAQRRIKYSKKLPKKAAKKRYSSEVKVRYKNKFPFKKLVILGGGTLLVFLFLYLTIFTSFFKIREWKVFNEDIIQENSKFNEFLAVHKGENLIFLNTDEIQKNIKDQYPEIEDLEIKKQYPSSLILKYKNYPEKANLLNIFNGKNQKKFIINEIGYLVEQDYENPNLPYIKMKTEKPLKINQYAIDRDKLEYILDAIYDFEEIFGMKVLDAEYKPKEREVHIKTEREFTIWLDTELSVQKQYSKLKAALSKLNIYTESLDYIDLRISSINGERVIYKRR